MALTLRRVAALTEPGRYGDGRGLYLQVTPAGVRSWLFRYQRDGRERAMGLGSVDDFTLEEARERARRARQLLQDGIDPIDHRKAEQIKQKADAARAAARNVTFRRCAEQYFEFHSPKWKNAKHAAQFMSTLYMYAFPVMGGLPVAEVDKALVLKAIQPIWRDKNETASRVRGRIEAVLDFAKVKGWREGDNPAAWAGNLAHALPAPGSFTDEKHHAALPYSEVLEFTAELQEMPETAARALEFLILTATRTAEVIGALWPEFDLTGRVWTIPPERMKGGKEHRVPLSERAIEILKSLPRTSEFVFRGERKESGINSMAMRRVLNQLGYEKRATVHGFRSSFRDWAAERTNYPNHVVEMALAHAIGSKVEAAYRRGDLFLKRQRLMNEWARYCNTPRSFADVTPISGVRDHGQAARLVEGSP